MNAVVAARTHPQLSLPTEIRRPAAADECVREAVTRAVRSLLANGNGVGRTDLHQLLMVDVETALLAEVLKHCRGNQSRAATLLGLSRGTLRKKLLALKLA